MMRKLAFRNLSTPPAKYCSSPHLRRCYPPFGVWADILQSRDTRFGAHYRHSHLDVGVARPAEFCSLNSTLWRRYLLSRRFAIQWQPSARRVWPLCTANWPQPRPRRRACSVLGSWDFPVCGGPSDARWYGLEDHNRRLSSSRTSLRILFPWYKLSGAAPRHVETQDDCERHQQCHNKVSFLFTTDKPLIKI